jgi:hypothetical protein
MVLPAKRATLTLREAESRTPAPAGVGAWAEQLREAAYDAVKDQDVKDLIETYMAKAKAGDLAAAKFVLNFLTGGAPKVQVQKVLVVKRSKSTNRQAPATPRREPTDAELDEQCGRIDPAESAMISTPAVKVLRRLAARILKSEGPTAAPALAGQLEVESEELETVMRCDWFKLVKGSWTLTPEGNASV